MNENRTHDNSVISPIMITYVMNTVCVYTCRAGTLKKLIARVELYISTLKV